MNLHKKATECGITPSSKAENEDLFRKITTCRKVTQEGKEAAERLIEGNMAYVVSKVESFLDEYTDYEYLRDDLISEGFLTLAKVADNLRKSEAVDEEEFNPQAMISVSLRNAFLNMIRVERETAMTDALESTLTYDDSAAIDLKLDILACCENDRDREIVRLRCDGLNDSRIGERLGLHRTQVCRRRQALHERFQATQ